MPGDGSPTDATFTHKVRLLVAREAVTQDLTAAMEDVLGRQLTRADRQVFDEIFTVPGPRRVKRLWSPARARPVTVRPAHPTRSLPAGAPQGAGP